MNRNKIEQWMSQALDGELSPRRRRRLEAELAVHPEWTESRQAWESIARALRTQADSVAPPQTPAAAWQDVQRAIRLQTAPAAADVVWPVWRWATVAATFLVVLWAGWNWTLRSGHDQRGAIAVADRTIVEWVETDVPDAMSMVYEDDATGLTIIWLLVQENGEESGHAG